MRIAILGLALLVVGVSAQAQQTSYELPTTLVDYISYGAIISIGVLWAGAGMFWWKSCRVCIALLGMALWAGLAIAQTTTIPLKVTFTWNDAAHTPITGVNFRMSQLSTITPDPTTHQPLNTWASLCDAPLDSTGTATCNVVINNAAFYQLQFVLFNVANNQAWCDTNGNCSIGPITFDSDGLGEAVNSAGRTTDKYLHATVRMSTGDDTVVSFSFN